LSGVIGWLAGRLTEGKGHGGEQTVEAGDRSRAEVDQRNVIGVAFGDLPEDDQRRIKDEMRCELEEIEAAKMREKLACY
jgi:hypothetical protein